MQEEGIGERLLQGLQMKEFQLMKRERVGVGVAVELLIIDEETGK